MAEKKQVWSTADIIKNRTNWTLASDVELLKHIQSLSEKLVNKSRSTLQLLNSFEDDVNSTCTSVANVYNRFEALSDTQFIENKVRDDSPETEEPSVEVQQQKETESSENITEKLNEALSNGIQVLRTQYDIIAVTDSESEDDEPQEVLLKARNPFMSRRLPYVIGSEEFNKHDHLGLVTSSEDEDDENDSEDDEEDDEKDDLPYLKKVVPQPERVIIGPNNRTQVIQVSSDSEDSDISSLGSRKHEEKIAQNYAHSRSAQNTPKTPHNFAEHLNATLQNVSSNVVTPLVDDLFLPPPLPTNEDDQSSVGEGSDNGSDIFVRRTNTKVAEPSTKPNIVSDIFDDEVSRNVESGRVSAKSSATTDISQTSDDSSTLKSAHIASNNEPHIPPKPRINVPTSKMFSAMNAELSNRFNKNVVAKDESSSSDDSDAAFSKSSPSSSDRKKRVDAQKQEKASESRNDSATSGEVSASSSVRIPKPHAEDVFENISSKSTPNKSAVAPKSRVDDVRSSSSSNSNQSPSNTSKPNTSKTKPKVVTLFDDDDSMDELFGSKSKDRKKVSSPATTSAPPKDLFNESDDLFSSTKEPQKLATSTTSLSSKKIALFDDDSDSGDDIFAIINSQKKKSTSNVTKTDVERKPLFPEDDSLGKIAPVENEHNLFAPNANESRVTSTSSTRTDIFEAKNTAEEKSSRENRTINEGTNLFDTDNESDDIFSISTKSKKEMLNREGEKFDSQIGEKSVEIEQHESTSKTLFESVISEKESLFESEKESADQDALGKTPSRPNVVPRSTFLENSNKNIPGTLFAAENDVPKKRTVHDLENNELANQDEGSKTTNQPNVIPRSKFFDNSDKMNSDVPASSISKGALFDSETDKPTKQTALAKGANKPSVLPRSKFIEKTNSFASSTLENQVTSDSGESVRSSRGAVSAPPRPFKEASTPPILSRILDVTADGSTVDKIDGNQALTSRPPAPAKLALNRGLNINVNALLPGSSWSSISKQVKGTVAETNNEEHTTPASLSETQSRIVIEPLKSAEQSPNSLTAMAKERTKIAGRRRPPSRRARVNKALQSDLFASNPTADSTDDEPDSAYKTASESNSPEKNSAVEKSETKIPQEERNDSIPSLEEIQFVPPTSAMTNYQKERSKLAKLVKKRPPSASKEKITVDGLPAADETENKNKTADDLGNILITASHSREPPAMMENDLKSALSDSDKDDYLFEDVTTENENINDPIPQIDAPSTLPFPDSAFSPPFIAPKTPSISKTTTTTTTTLFESSEEDQSEDLFANLKTPNSPPSAACSSSNNTKSVVSSNITDRPPENSIIADKPVALEKDAPASDVQFTNDSSANITSKSGKKSTSDLFSFNEDNSDDDDDLEALFSKVISPKVSTSTKSREISPVSPASNVPAFDPNKEPDGTLNTSQEAIVSEPFKKADLFAENDSPPKIETSVKSRTTRIEVEKSDLFAPPEVETSVKSRATPNEVSSLQTHSSKRAKKSSKTTTNLFDDDDDELFSTSKSSVKTKTAPSKSLFADDDDDDNSLFGSAAVPSHRGDKSIGISRSSGSTAPAEKARIVKLRSQTVEKDPLTGKIMKE